MDDAFKISDVEYVCRPMRGRFASTPGRFCLIKTRWQVEWYADLLRDLAPRGILEVGLYDGASMALAAELARPDKIIGIDRRPLSTDALDDFIARKRLDSSVRPFYGVDQTDRDALDLLVRTEFCDLPLDLVVDDASHLLDATRITFNCLYPYVPPGGTYVIEDWPMHKPLAAAASKGAPPLTMLAFELILACSDRSDAVAAVSLNRNYVVVTRGEAVLDPQSFDLADCLGPSARSLLAPQTP